MNAETKSPLTGKLGMLSPKARQYLMLGILGAAFLGLVFGSVALWDSQPAMTPQNSKELQSKNIAAPGAQVDPRDVWMAQSSQQLKEMDSVIQSLKQKINELEQKQATQAEQQQQPVSILPPLPPLNPPAQPQPVPPPSPDTAETKADLPPPLPQQPREPGIASYEVSDASAPSKDEESQTQRGKVYIPSGSFMRVALLGGLDAPTGGQAQNNPWPVLMRVQDNAFLPNRYRARVKECFMLGQGYGDISSERAYIRLESLSCVLNNGEVVDTPAKGYIVGEDGKAGMRGRLVSKQGQVLANALMTGIIAGIGQGIQQSATTYNTTPLGTVGTVDPGEQFKAGIGAGVGKALDRLSQYYITLAEKLFPIIEVDAGRVVDVVLTKGLTLGLGPSIYDGDYTDVWKRGRQIMRRPLNPLE